VSVTVYRGFFVGIRVLAATVDEALRSSVISLASVSRKP